MTNAEKYAKEIAQVIANGPGKYVCLAFQGFESRDCKGCPMKKMDCHNLECVTAWLKDESNRYI